ERRDLARLALAEHAHLLGLGVRERLDLRRLLLRSREVRLALVRLNGDRDVGLGERGLLLRARLRLAQLALLDRRGLLARVGLDLLLGDLPRAQLLQDRLDPRGLVARLRPRRRRADQPLLELEVVAR